ncbi:uncharacterized protein V6R79_012247 [Siganus canaliculatus]
MGLVATGNHRSQGDKPQPPLDNIDLHSLTGLFGFQIITGLVQRYFSSFFKHFALQISISTSLKKPQNVAFENPIFLPANMKPWLLSITGAVNDKRAAEAQSTAYLSSLLGVDEKVDVFRLLEVSCSQKYRSAAPAVSATDNPVWIPASPSRSLGRQP